jgi:hypothetical protein
LTTLLKDHEDHVTTNEMTTMTLPAAEQVGESALWHLPVGNDTVHIDADFIGHASSRRDHHEGHTDGSYGSTRSRCRACRWFEPRIFRENPDPERYLILFTGETSVPGEHTHTRIEWAHSGDEVVAALATPNEVTPHKCPVCDGNGGTERKKCHACGGTGIVQVGGVRFTLPASRVLSQAASFDEEIREAWEKYQRPVAS